MRLTAFCLSGAKSSVKHPEVQNVQKWLGVGEVREVQAMIGRYSRGIHGRKMIIRSQCGYADMGGQDSRISV